jgi:XapX domain-containing protein
MKPAIGLAVAFTLGMACRAFGIPSPAPPVIVGALLVMAMTLGYVAVDRWAQLRGVSADAVHAHNSAGPTGDVAGRPYLPRPPLEQITWSLGLLGLCATYLQGGINKLPDFPGAVAEAGHFGLPVPSLTAVLTIITELGASFLILAGVMRWLGALTLACFTLTATFIANGYWQLAPGPERFISANGFFEHLGLAGDFFLVALLDWRQR